MSPLPSSSDPGKTIRVLAEENKNRKDKRPRKQMIAIALENARRHGAKIPKK